MKLMINPNQIDPSKAEVRALLEQGTQINSPKIKTLIGIDWPVSIPNAERVWCFLHDKKTQPICPFSGKPAHFIYHKFEYAVCSKEYWAFIKNDSQIKAVWLSWYALFKAGLSIENAVGAMETKQFQELRLYCTAIEVFSTEALMERLILDDFHSDMAEKITSEVDVHSITSLTQLADIIRSIKAHRNVSIEYWIQRGWNVNEAKTLLKRFFQAGSSAIKERCVNDVYRSWFNSTRLAGLKGQQRSSSMELQIIGILQTAKLTTKVNQQSEFAQKTGRSWFVHDAYLPDHKLIIEYNGVYWHQNAQFELEKAYYCIQQGYKYMALWEGDFSTADEYTKFVTESLQHEGPFFSSNPAEILAYYEYSAFQETQRSWDKTFLDVSDRIALQSKCMSKKVCAIAVKDRRIIATGINGSPSGAVNCCDVFEKVTPENRAEHRAWSQANEIHAEQNLIAIAASEGIPLRGSTVYVNLQPCQQCSLHLTSIGIKRIVYLHEYDFADTSYTRALFKRGRILFEHYKE